VKESLLTIAENLGKHDYKSALSECESWGDQKAGSLLHVVEMLAEEQENTPAGIFLAYYQYRNYEITAPAFSRAGALAAVRKEYEKLTETEHLESWETALEWGNAFVIELPLNKATWL
jgi:hypothetical protein